MSTDGYLKIKTKIDNSEVPKGVKELEDKIKKAQVDNTNSSQEQRNLENEINAYERLKAQADSYNQKIKELNLEKNKMTQNNPGMAVSQDSAELTSIKAQIDSINQKYKQTVSEIDKQAPKMDRVHARLTKVKAKQTENNTKISEYKQKIESIKTQHIENSVNNVGKGISKQISSLGKMAIGIVGIQAGWGAVKSAVGLVSQYNTQVSTDLDYMKFCLANAITPVIQRLISLAMTLLSYINAITSAWFGVNLFTNATAKNFQKMQKGADSTAKSAREIQKSLQGFDEMNVLSDNSDQGSSGSGVSAPSMDLSSMQAPVPAWLQWIIDNKGLILSIIAGITGGIIAWKSGLGAIKSLGIGVLIMGIVYAIESLVNYLQNPTWENFGGIIQGIGVALLGLAIIIGSVPLAVIGAAVLIVGTIIKYWDKIKAFLQEGIDWLTGKSDWVHEMFGDTIGNIYDIFVENLQLILNWFDTTFTNIRKIFDELINFVKNVFTGNWKGAWENVKNIFKTLWNEVKTSFFTILELVNNKAKMIGQTVGDVISGAFKAVVNGVLGAIEGILNAPIKAINSLIGTINKVPGINLSRLNTFNLPRMAKGGVLTQPTPVIAGEAGKEMIMPLENNLEYLDILADKLASKIGSGGGCYILNIDSKTVQRGMAQRSNGLVFATNGR